MTDHHVLACGQAVVVDLPASVRRTMPIRHFVLAELAGREALLRAGEPVPPLDPGVPAVLTVARQGPRLESVVVGVSPPNGLTVLLARSPDRRVSPRVPVELSGELETIDDSGFEPVRISSVNISVDGAMLRSPQPVPTGSKAFVALTGPGLGSFMAIAHVRDCTMNPGDTLYRVRVQFSSVADDAARRLDRWVGEFLVASRRGA